MYDPMHDPKMLRRMGVRISGVTDKVKKRFTDWERRRLHDLCRNRYSQLIKVLDLERGEIDQMMTDILRGYRNYNMYYSDHGDGRSHSAYIRFFCSLTRELEGFHA